jgi:hypothetical protein
MIGQDDLPPGPVEGFAMGGADRLGLVDVGHGDRAGQLSIRRAGGP